LGVNFYVESLVRLQECCTSCTQPGVSQKSDELRAKIDNARTLIAEQVAKNAAAARDAINDKVPVAAEKINQAVDVVRGQLDNAANALRNKAAEIAVEDGESPAAQAAASAPDKIEPNAPEAASSSSDTAAKATTSEGPAQ
jgi:hypothetical protein